MPLLPLLTWRWRIMCRCAGRPPDPGRINQPNRRSGRPEITLLGGEMFDDSNIIVGLEIGTSKVCAVVGEQNADGGLNIVGVGQSRSRGVRKGEVVDTAQAEDDVRNAIVEAEQMADVEIRNVYLGVTGGHI